MKVCARDNTCILFFLRMLLSAYAAFCVFNYRLLWYDEKIGTETEKES